MKSCEIKNKLFSIFLFQNVSTSAVSMILYWISFKGKIFLKWAAIFRTVSRYVWLRSWMKSVSTKNFYIWNPKRQVFRVHHSKAHNLIRFRHFKIIKCRHAKNEGQWLSLIVAMLILVSLSATVWFSQSESH